MFLNFLEDRCKNSQLNLVGDNRFLIRRRRLRVNDGKQRVDGDRRDALKSVGSELGSMVFFCSGLVAGCTWRETLGTCVFESDFGFALNCAFKKSGLFRVRNLGGVKGYVGLGESK